MLISTNVVAFYNGELPTEVDEDTGFTREQCEDLGLPFSPKPLEVSEDTDTDSEKVRDVTLWFRAEDVRRIEDDSKNPLLVLDGGLHYELKSSQEVFKILNSLNNK